MLTIIHKGYGFHPVIAFNTRNLQVLPFLYVMTHIIVSSATEYKILNILSYVIYCNKVI